MVKHFLKWLRTHGKMRLKLMLYVNRIAHHIAVEHILAIGDILETEALTLLPHSTMPLYDADYPAEIAE